MVNVFRKNCGPRYLGISPGSNERKENVHSVSWKRLGGHVSTILVRLESGGHSFGRFWQRLLFYRW